LFSIKLSIPYNTYLSGPEDPNDFISERQIVKRHPVAWIPFDVGMRFALMELKMCLIRILADDQIEEGLKQQEKFVSQPDTMFIKLEKHSINSS
jgi:hypothetical protein